MKPATLRLYQTLHTWVGLMAGWALFIAFFAGAITVFHGELHAWQSHARIAGTTHGAPDTDPAAIDRFVSKLVATHPTAANSVYVVLPTEGEPDMSAYWQDAAFEWQAISADKLSGANAGQQDTSFDHIKGELANFMNTLHYTLGIPGMSGMYFMGAVSILYGLALVSGVLLHLPRLKKDLFAVRPGRNLKRFWMDAHNVIGLFSLPFHLIFAITGALFSVALILAMAFNVMVFDGKLMDAMPQMTSAVPEVKAAGRPAEMLPAAKLLAIAREETDERFKPHSIRYQRIGDANAMAEVRGNSEQSLGGFGSIGIHAAAGEPNAGKVVANQTAGARDTNHTVNSALYSLHFGNFGELGVRMVYLLAGLAGAFLFYSGNLLWIESRRRIRQAEQPRVHKLLAQATVGVCIGCCIGVSAAFIGALLWPEHSSAYSYFPVFFAALAWALVRPPVRAAVELLYTAALVSVMVPVMNAIVTGDHLWQTVSQGNWAVAGFDIGALAFAAGYIALARATMRRAANGPAESVWATPAAQRRAATRPVAVTDPS